MGPTERPPSAAEETPPRPSLYRRVLRRLASYWAQPQDGEQTPESVSEAHLGQERPLRDHRIQPSLCRRAGPEPARSLAANGDAGARPPSPAFTMVPLSWETCFRRSVLSGPGSLSCQYEVKGTRVESQQLGPGGQAAGSSPSAVERSDVNGRR